MTTYLFMAGSGGGTGGGTGFFISMILIIVVIYFLMIRPQSKKQKEHKQMVENLKKGDNVVTAGGMMGTVAGIKEKENTVLIKVAENTKIEILRSSISRVVEKQKGKV